MKLWIYKHLSDVTEMEYERDIRLLPEWRRAQASSYRFLIDRVLCAKAYLLLKQGLSEMYGITENPQFDYTESGKPMLKGYPDIHFNLSHCRQGVLCAIDDSPVGCDIEGRPKKLDLEVCRRVCNDDEIKSILDAEDPCMAFARLWTRKEAFLKMQGEGINENMSELFSRGLPPGLELYSWTEPECGFAYSVCTQTVKSESKNTCKKKIFRKIL